MVLKVITLQDPQNPLYGTWFRSHADLDAFKLDYGVPGMSTSTKNGFLWGLPIHIATPQAWAQLLLHVLADQATQEEFITKIEYERRVHG